MPARVKTLILALALFFLNVYICRELFRVEYLRHRGSIEGAFIGIARYLMTHWRDLQWFPLWYDGIPYQNRYPPLLHSRVAVTAWIRGFSAAHAYHWVTALIYCLGPVTLFALALRLSGSRWAAFAAGAIYSFVSSSAWLVPAIGRDLGNPLFPRRLQALVYYGEGPHVSALTLLPLALLFLDMALARKRAPYIFLAALGFAAVALTNWLAAFALAMLIISYLLARAGAEGWKWRDVAWTALIAAAAYGLAMPWLPPSTIAVTQVNAQTLGGDFRQVYHALPRWILVILFALVWIKVVVRRLTVHLQFAIFFAFLMALLTLVYGWWEIAIVPQAIRYHLEMEMAVAVLIAFVAQAMLKRQPRWVAGVAIGVLVLALALPVRRCRRYARDFLIAPLDITTTTEWKTAKWLNEQWSGERVMAPGSTAFWLTAFTDTPELAGGFEQGTTDFMIRIAIYGIYTGETAGAHDAEFSVLWLKALGVQAVGVSGPASGEFYKPFHNPWKFEGVPEPLWRDGDDVFYQVGPPHASLARVVHRSDLVAREPINGVDVDPLRPYVAALENPAMPRAEFRWTSGHSAIISTNLQPDQVVPVQIAWHRGWHASINGSRQPVKRDALGLMTIEPHVAGPCVLDLVYDGGAEMRAARILSALTALLLVVLTGRDMVKIL